MIRYGRIQDGRVFEIIKTDLNIEDLYAPTLTWVALTPWPDCVVGWAASELDGVWTLAPYVPPPPTDAEIIAANTSKLQQYTQLATAQKSALTNRIGTLNDAIELEMATPEEEAELPVRTLQLKAWKTYAVLLGRVTTQAGWALTVEWPVQPTAGMDLTVSAVAKAVQAS
jgi:hypothetical protein